MKKNVLRIFTLALCIALVLSLLAGCGEPVAATAQTLTYSEMSFNDEGIESGTVAENNRFVLTWDNAIKQVFFTDKVTGQKYGSMPQEATVPKYDAEGMLIKNNPQIESPIVVYYYDPKAITESATYAGPDAITDGAVYTEKIENGIRVTYDFWTPEISVPVEYTISDNTFKISVDPSKISDNGETYVTAVAIAPFMCSLPNDTQDSYLFLPDGSGTLAKPVTKDLTGTQGQARVYSDDLIIQTYDIPYYVKDMSMPIFGKKQGNSALLGVITESSEQAYLNWHIGADNIKYSTVYPFFRIRGYSLIESPRGFPAASIEIKVFNEYINTNKLEVSYFALDGEDASYSGMAKTYRKYLESKGMLTKSQSEQTAVSLKILGGLKQKEFTFGIPHTVLKSMTTINQAQEITKYFTDNVDGELLVELVGFGESGIDLGKVGGGFTVAKEFGKTKDVKALSDFAQQNGVKLFLNFDILGYNKSGSGFRAHKDNAKLLNGQEIYLNSYDNVTRKKAGERHYILSRGKLGLAVDKGVAATDKYNIQGVAFESLTNNVYSDYKVEGASASAGMINQVRELLAGAGANKMILGNAAHDYAVSSCDYVIEVPTTSSGYDFSYCDVPFYQMVFRDIVPLSSQSINLAVDERKEVLRSIESGLTPTFTLIHDYETTYANMGYPSLYGASFEGVKENAVKIIKEVAPVLEKVKGATLVKHTVIEPGIRVSEFSNGVKIAVNETKNAATVMGKTVEAMNYTVWEG